jgi:hypothetical protein
VTCRCCVVGPDVESGSGLGSALASGAKGSTKGLFGLSFDDLLRSEWVQDDTITFKVHRSPPRFPPTPSSPSLLPPPLALALHFLPLPSPSPLLLPLALTPHPHPSPSPLTLTLHHLLSVR